MKLIGETMLTDARKNLLLHMPKNAICAEVGVWKGKLTKAIIEFTEPKELHLIDPWLILSEFEHRQFGGKGGESGKGVRTQQEMDAMLSTLESELDGLDNIVFNRGFSEQILGGFPDDYFDWIYIDGNHEYEYVAKDLALSFQKVKPGGFITGNAYFWVPKERPDSTPPVKKAVDEFVIGNGLQERTQLGGNQYVISL